MWHDSLVVSCGHLKSFYILEHLNFRSEFQMINICMYTHIYMHFAYIILYTYEIIYKVRMSVLKE